jgi:ABC-type molybdate transport system permease subunit
MKTVALVFAAAIMSAPAMAGPLEDALSKLDPQERSHQACILKGMDTMRQDVRLKKADRMKTQILSPAILDKTQLTGKGGAVRVGNHWYAMSFTCQLSANLAKATSFTFALGNEIPKASWDKHGLWQ